MIFKSPFADVEIPDVSLTDYALEHAETYGERAAFIDASTDRTVTYSELRAQVAVVAAAFAERGMGAGEVLAICLPNLPEFAVAVYAATSIGLTVTTVNPLYTAEELGRQLADANAKYFLTLAQFVAPYQDVLDQVGIIETFVIGGAAKGTPWSALLTCTKSAPQVDFDAATQLAALPYSSGTTGLPKGVMLTHRALVANVCMGLNGPNKFEDGEVFACVPPMFHIYGIIMYLGLAMRVGATVVCMPRFDFESYIKVIERYRATFAVVVPPVALGLAQHPLVDAHDLSSLRTIVSSAAPLAPALAAAMEQRLGARVVQGYGMTEVAGASHVQREGDAAESVGVALPNIQWKVIDVSSGATLARGEHGEVCVKGPSLMRGYLNKPEATAETIDKDGW